ncbi:3-oxoacyl-ACP reductase (plasmid) [Mycolicibacterium arabiense]|uniref:3-oxoacyl-ACP reductase n=1 Tax=Mycolicibacterium arabiense TaxID=1286181 RepID=A0A7I7RQ43_9MYCO|nr:SDR family oxidoreductase [Mycolicibacterium arabiense]MCV7371985.1 SDR family oxidoreductase [Mycolicibacterium arabiense]BBY46694.1 3-oxoacyl-ACP reductase [Mycolicibacterium arabiense]
MDLGLSGKTAVVTGASHGIGLATAEALAAEGVRVLGVARTTTPDLERVAAGTVRADLGTPDGAAAMIDSAMSILGGIDILINNVGAGEVEKLASGGLAGFLDVSDDQWRELLVLNLFSAIWACRAALPSLIERRGAIVNVSTTSTRVPASAPVGYSEAKAALTALSKRLGEEFGPHGVRVNTVSPGVVGSRLWRGSDGIGARFAAADGVGLQDFLAGLPERFGITTGRITEPREVAALITFLASEVSANVLGADVVIDGGMVKST